MTFDYFKYLEDKYKTRLSHQKPIVIRFDGKGVTKNKDINLLDESKGGFAFALKQTALFSSRKFNCIALASSDELSLIITDTSILLKEYGSFECQKIASLIVQDISPVFHRHYEGLNILFDARVFNIPQNKISSYLIYRMNSARNIHTIYYSKNLLSPAERTNKKLNEVEMALDSILPDFKNRSDYLKTGACFYIGDRIDSQKLLEQLKLIHFDSIDLSSLIIKKTQVIISDEKPVHDDFLDELLF